MKSKVRETAGKVTNNTDLEVDGEAGGKAVLVR